MILFFVLLLVVAPGGIVLMKAKMHKKALESGLMMDEKVLRDPRHRGVPSFVIKLKRSCGVAIRVAAGSLQRSLGCCQESRLLQRDVGSRWRSS
jgi:hypothetical protein